MLGDNLLSLIKAYSYRNIPLELVKHIAKQVMYTHFVLPLCIWNRACVCVPSIACCGERKMGDLTQPRNVSLRRY